MDVAPPHGKILVFLNYRRADEPYASLYLDGRLTERFGHGRVFRDSRTIPPGSHFPAEIWRALQECQIMIVVIGKRWLRPGPDGLLLIDCPDDYVRLEIAEALRRNILVVPVLIDEASLPPKELLPADIKGLMDRQYRNVRFRTADCDISRLVEELAQLLGDAALPMPPSCLTGNG